MKIVRTAYSGYQSECPRCGTVIELEDTDRPEIKREQIRHGEYELVISHTCPICQNNLTFEKPNS